MNGDMEFSFEMSNKEIERIKNILTSGGLRHYLLEIADDEELDVVEYKEYQKLQQENKILKENAENNDKVVDKVNWENMLLKNQQKGFINYLEDEYTKIQSEIEKETNNNAKYFKIERRQTITGILQKYKEIIGVSDEKK